ncbi:MAG: transaldolase [Chloroflexi bacterium]|nr:transaldolase [Chloroflexota bacterium]
MNSIQQAHQIGQAIWVDDFRRAWLKSGELKRLVDLGITGLTANPTIMERAIVESHDYDEAIARLAREGKNPAEIYESMAVEDIRAAADLMRPVWDETRGLHGYPCLEINPLVAYDTGTTVAEGRRLFRALDRPNVMVKVPATPEGLPAIRTLTAGGVNVNVTLIFSLEAYAEVRKAYFYGLEEALHGGARRMGGVASMASFFLSRIDTLVDSLLEERIRRGHDEVRGLLGKAAIASARLAYQDFKDEFYGKGFRRLSALGARVQRPLWASTGTKNPAYGDVRYVESLIGPDTVNTLPVATLEAFLDHGRTEASLERDIPEARQALAGLREAGIDMKQVADKLLADGVTAFSDSFRSLLAHIEEKKLAISRA